MAEINFQLLHNANGTAAVDNLGGSGLAFYGSSAGSSVQIGEYQGMTRIASADGSTYVDETNNIKYKTKTRYYFEKVKQCQAKYIITILALDS